METCQVALWPQAHRFLLDNIFRSWLFLSAPQWLSHPEPDSDSTSPDTRVWRIYQAKEDDGWLRTVLQKYQSKARKGSPFKWNSSDPSLVSLFSCISPFHTLTNITSTATFLTLCLPPHLCSESHHNHHCQSVNTFDSCRQWITKATHFQRRTFPV